VISKLRRRIERLEARWGSNLETDVRALAQFFGVSAEPMLDVARENEAWLSRQIGDGAITWEGFCYLYDRGAFQPDEEFRARFARTSGRSRIQPHAIPFQ
jgi:hypothetical protein